MKDLIQVYQTFISCVLIVFVIHILFQDNLIQENLNSISIINLRSQTKKIIPALAKIIKDNPHNHQTIQDLIECKTVIEVVKCAISNPKQFQIDFADINIFKLLNQIEDITSFEHQLIIKNFISKDNFQILTNMQNINSKEEIKKWFDILKEAQMDVLVNQRLYQHGIIYDQNYFKFLMQEVEKTQFKVKSQQSLNFTKELSELDTIIQNEYYQNSQMKIYNNSSTSIQTSFQNNKISNVATKQNKIFHNKINSMFQDSLYDKLQNKINKMNLNYSIVEDTILFKSQQKFIDNDFVQLKMKKQEENINLDTDNLWSILECYLQIERNKQQPKSIGDQKSHFYYDSNLVKFYTTIGKDKLFSTIEDKIQRKITEGTVEHGNYFQNSVKDPKRLSLIFENEQELVYFQKMLRNTFNTENYNQINLSKYNLIIRIKNIKNLFNFDTPKEDYKDLKIIFEFYYIKKDISIQLECQCNLKRLIEWKKADHIFQTFNRSENNFKELNQKLERFQFMESKLRSILKTIQMSCYFLCLILQLSILIQAVNYFFDNKLLISCKNNSSICLYKCLNQNFPQDECNNQIKRLLKNNSNDFIPYIAKQLNDQCQKFNNDYYVSQICWNAMHLDREINFSKSKNSNLICYTVNSKINCIQKNKMTEILKSQSIKDNLVLSNRQFISQNKNEINLSESQISKEMKTFIEKINPTNINKVRITDNRICISILSPNKLNSNPNQKLHCSEAVYPFTPNSLSCGVRHCCFIRLSRVVCWGRNTTNQLDIPLSARLAAQLASGGWHTCALTAAQAVRCWGSSNFHESMAPLELEALQVVRIATGHWFSCALDEGQGLHCWGSNITGLNDLPALLGVQGVQMMELGQANACVLLHLDRKIFCWGSNKYQLLDFTEAVENNYWLQNPVEFSIGVQSICIIDHKSKVNCLSIFNNLRIDEELSNNVKRVRVTNNLINILQNDHSFKMLEHKEELSLAEEVKTSTLLFSGNKQSGDEFLLCNIVLSGRMQCVSDDEGISDLIPSLISTGIRLPKENEDQIQIESAELDHIVSFDIGPDDSVCYQYEQDANKQHIHLQFNLPTPSPIIKNACFRNFKSDSEFYDFDILEDNYCINLDGICFIPKEEFDTMMCLKYDYKLKDMQVETILKFQGRQPIGIECSYDRMCVLLDDHTLRCAGGKNEFDKNIIDQDVNYDVMKFSAGMNATCFITSNRKIICNGLQARNQYKKIIDI